MITPQFDSWQCKPGAALIYMLAFHGQLVRAEGPALHAGEGLLIPLVSIAPGQFEMGRPSDGAFIASALSFGEQGDWASEGPVRTVAISKPFLIGKYKISCKQFCEFLNATDNPGQYVNINTFSWIEKIDGRYVPKEGKDAYPINVVHWDGATQFCQWLSKTSGRHVRLPTEAEWEYVARGTQGRKVPWGTKKIFAWTLTDGAAVDAFPDNATPEGVVGLVDRVIGEWCSDFYGVRYLPEDKVDPQGPSKEQLPVKSDLIWLAAPIGESHVLRGRVKHLDWSTTSRSLGSRVTNSGIYGFRIVVELDVKDHQP